jgi:hypothetical protein
MAQAERILCPNSLAQTSHAGKVRKRTCSTPGCGYIVRRTKEYVWQVSNPKQVHTHTFPPNVVYQPSQTRTLEDALKDIKEGRQLPFLFIKEAIDVHVMTGGVMKPQLIYQALKQWQSFSSCIYFTHPELARSMVSKMRNYKDNNRTRNLPLNFSPLTGDCASDFGQFISNNNNWYKLPTGQGMISHFVDLYKLADHVGIQMSELDRFLCLEPPTRGQVVNFLKDGTNTNIKLKPDDLETVRCTCVATSFFCSFMGC